MDDDILEDADVPDSVRTALGDEYDLILLGLNADARRIAPCLVPDSACAPTDDQLASAKLLLLSVIKRWAEDGVTARSVQVGPFAHGGQTPVTTAGYKLWPTEIERLQAICGGNSVTSIEMISHQGRSKRFQGLSRPVWE